MSSVKWLYESDGEATTLIENQKEGKQIESRIFGLRTLTFDKMKIMLCEFITRGV